MNLIKWYEKRWGASGQSFVRYLLVGGSGVLLDISLLYLCTDILQLWAPISTLVSQTFVVLYNFFFNKYWSFESKINGKQQFIRYLVLVALNYFVSFGSMYLFFHILGQNYLLVRIFTIIGMVPLNFLAYKHWVYTEGGFAKDKNLC